MFDNAILIISYRIPSKQCHWDVYDYEIKMRILMVYDATCESESNIFIFKSKIYN